MRLTFYKNVTFSIFPIIALLVLTAATATPSYSQACDSTLTEKGWWRLSPNTDTVGIDTQGAYRQIEWLSAQKILVAVIDTGIDTTHADLKSILWRNPGEIPSNGLDDDANGYTDDVYGWNFIGGKDGRNVGEDTQEITREYARLHKKYDTTDRKNIPDTQREEYRYYLQLKDEFASFEHVVEKNDTLLEAEHDMNFTDSLRTVCLQNIEECKTILRDTADERVKRRLAWARSNLRELTDLKSELSGLYKELCTAGSFDKKHDITFDPRSIVGDNYGDLSERHYGNNDCYGTNPMHGTHVAGIIGSVANGGLGNEAVFHYVSILCVRAVPDGDERDKDVANAIFYAVERGAKIINLSFGKALSPDCKYVREAIRYGGRHDVLFVHAAGNSGQDNDRTPVYPNVWEDESLRKYWIEVGASAKTADENLKAPFSNYGRHSVDMFAPGTNICSTAPSGGYTTHSGTSMAAPMVSGVAAIIRACYPELKAPEVRAILLESSRRYKKLDVAIPSTRKKRYLPFGKICATGGVLNAQGALRLAKRIAWARR